MNASRKVLRTTAWLLFAGCQSPGATFTDQDAAQIRGQIDTYVSSALAADWDAYGAILAPDVVFFPPNQSPVVGHEAAMTWARAFPTMAAFTTDVQDISGVGDLAVAHGTYSLSVTMEDGTPLMDQGSWVNVFRKQADGSWAYTRSIWHSDDPLPDAGGM